MHDRCVITVTHIFSDRCERRLQHFAAEVHRDLTRIYDLAASFASCNIRSGNVKMLCYRINDELRSDDFLFIWRNNIAEHLFCKVQVDLTFLQIGICYDFV